jgi:hypothetical protein
MGRCTSSKRTRNAFKTDLKEYIYCVRIGTDRMSPNVVELFRSGNLILSTALSGDPEWIPALPGAVMHKRFILLFGLFLSGHVPAAAQTPAPRIDLAQEHVAPIVTLLPTAANPLPAASFLLSQNPGKSNAHFSLLFSGAYERDYDLKHLSPMDEVKTLTLTQSILPLVQLWGGRLQLDAFQSTLHVQNVQFDPFGNNGMRGSRLSGRSYPGGPRSVHLSGLSLSFHFGRDARTGHPAEAWRRLSRVLRTVLD